MNLIDMCLQALFYERNGRRAEPPTRIEPAGGASAGWEALDEFFETARSRFETDMGARLFAAVESRYLAVRSGS
jgi:putative hydrolase of HD superfamily